MAGRKQPVFPAGEAYLWAAAETEREQVTIHEVYQDAAVEFGLHSHPYYEVIQFYSGQVQYLLGGARYRLQSGDIIVIPPQVEHRPVPWGERTGPYHRMLITLSREFMETFYRYCPTLAAARDRATVLHITGTEWESLTGLCRTACLEQQQRRPGWGATVRADMLLLMVGISRAICEIPPPQAEQRETMDAILEYIGRHLSRPLSAEALARRFYMGKSTLNRLFREKMGVSLHQYLTQRRLAAARAQVLHGEPLEQAAARAGFSDYSLFYRAFRREYGISPAAYKRLCRAGSGAGQAGLPG